MTIIIKVLVMLILITTVVFSAILLPFWATGALVLLIIGGLVSWLLFFASKAQRETTFVPTGEIMFVVQGDSCLRVLANLGRTGWVYDNDTGEIVEENIENKHKHPHSYLGVYWVSILYPQTQIHTWVHEWLKPTQGDPKKGEDPHLVEPRKEWVDSLFLFYTYPIHAKDVELKGNIKINIRANVTIRIVNPIKAVFIFKGNYVNLVGAAISGAISDFCREITLDAFRTIEKEGPNNPFSNEIMQLNNSGTKKTPVVDGGIPKTWGITIAKVDFEGYDLSDKSQVVLDAVQAVEVARLEQLADVERGTGIVTIGKSTAQAFDSRLEVANKYRGGVEALQEQLRMAGVSAFQGSVLSLGQQSPLGIVVDTKTTKKEKVK